ncbi:MAG TPA: hypothetical protein VH477_19355 [Bryobacteraceae bacterium]|jgi:uncharacterized protein YxeA
MKKIMAAVLGLGLLSGTAVFAQNTAQSTDTNTMKSSKKHKKHKKSTDTTATTSTTK